MRQTAKAFGFGEVEVQEFGKAGRHVAALCRSQPGGEAAQSAVVQKARDAFGNDYEFRRVETVGPARLGRARPVRHASASCSSVIAVLFYLWFRFERELAIGAIIGTLHDIVLTIGFFVITQHEFNMTSIAAILTIVGYSLNETVVVFDRTRELMRRYKTMPAEELLDLSINSTMSRTVMTATTAFLSLLALVLFGGQRHRGLRAGDAVRRRDLHLFGDLHLDAGADLSRRARSARGRPASAQVPKVAGRRSRRVVPRPDP